jgi:hypothetical protein
MGPSADPRGGPHSPRNVNSTMKNIELILDQRDGYLSLRHLDVSTGLASLAGFMMVRPTHSELKFPV